MLLILITFFQEVALQQKNTDLYYDLTKLHFRLYFGKNLIDECLSDSRAFKAAQHRHGCMVVSIIWSHSSSKSKNAIFMGAKESFMKNLILEAPL